MQIANSDKPVAFYSLDVIISVGYRVNSIRATAFRQWATSVLKQYMLKGYVVNHNAVSEQKYEDLKRALGLLENVFSQNFIMAEQQAKELFAVVKDYTYALDTLDAYNQKISPVAALLIFYLPMQKFLKMLPRTSSVEISPTMEPRW